MIRCNLAVLLAEKNLKITKMSKETGISRTTLTTLASNRAQGIQLDTLNKICLYLDTTPDQLLSFVPASFADIYIDMAKETTEEILKVKVFMNILEYDRYLPCIMNGIAHLTIIDNKISGVYINFDVDENCADPNVKLENQIISRNIKKLPRPFLNDLKIIIKDIAADKLEMLVDSDEIGFKLASLVMVNISWSFDAE